MSQLSFGYQSATKRVVDFVTGSTKFYVRDNIAYETVTNRPRFRIARNYWFDLPSDTGLPVLIDHDGLIYCYPPEGPPQFYCNSHNVTQPKAAQFAGTRRSRSRGRQLGAVRDIF